LRAARDVGADEQPFHALVLVAQALLELEHTFAHHRETEVPRLDDAGMDGADRNFVRALAADLDEVVIGWLILVRTPGGIAGVVAQRDTNPPASRRGAARAAGRRRRWRCRPCRAWRAACGWRR
jgi:hypothetical protein